MVMVARTKTLFLRFLTAIVTAVGISSSTVAQWLAHYRILFMRVICNVEVRGHTNPSLPTLRQSNFTRMIMDFLLMQVRRRWCKNTDSQMIRVY